jgi:hypothetical protein
VPGVSVSERKVPIRSVLQTRVPFPPDRSIEVPHEVPDWISYRRLLAEFMLPNSADTVARSSYWSGALGEPVKTVLGRLKAKGLLIEPNDPRARMRHNRDESDLRVLCLEHGLPPTGNADQLADRLLTIDPTGWLLGYAGELLQCSNLTDRKISDDEGIWEMLKRHAQQSAREGNLALCRNVHVAMANHLIRRSKRGTALQTLCIVCIFDLCGVRNRDDLPAGIRKLHSRFDPARASLAPWLVSRVRSLSRELALSTDGIREVFLRVGTRLPVPRDPRQLWAELRRALEGDLDSDDDRSPC